MGNFLMFIVEFVLATLMAFAAGTAFGHWLRGNTENHEPDHPSKQLWQRKLEQTESTETERSLQMEMQPRRDR